MYITVPSPPSSPYLPRLHPCQLKTNSFDTRHYRELIRTYPLKYRGPLSITPTYDLLPVDFYGPAFWSCPTLLLDRLSPKSRKCLWRDMELNVLWMSVLNLNYRPLSRRLHTELQGAAVVCPPRPPLVLHFEIHRFSAGERDAEWMPRFRINRPLSPVEG
jgi:hypothetical protein